MAENGIIQKRHPRKSLPLTHQSENVFDHLHVAAAVTGKIRRRLFQIDFLVRVAEALYPYPFAILIPFYFAARAVYPYLRLQSRVKAVMVSCAVMPSSKDIFTV